MLKHADGESERVIDRSHPLRVALSQVVVDRDQVRTVAFERVQVERQRGHEGFAFARPHFGDLALVEHDPADHLNVVVAHLHLPPGDFAHHRERLGQDVVQSCAVLEPGDEFGGLGPELVVAQALHLVFPLADSLDRARQLLHLTRVGVAQQRPGPVFRPIQQTHPAIPIHSAPAQGILLQCSGDRRVVLTGARVAASSGMRPAHGGISSNNEPATVGRPSSALRSFSALLGQRSIAMDDMSVGGVNDPELMDPP